MKILIGIPCFDGFRAGTVTSLFGALPNISTGNEILLEVRRACYLHLSREKLLQSAIDQKCSHLFFIDTDMSFGPDAMAILLSRDKDIIGGNYSTRSKDPHSTVKMFDIDRKRFVGTKYSDLPKEPFRCAAVATGFMVVKMDSILKSNMKRPYFDFNWDEEGNFVGEDVDFCLRANEAGLEVWCDPTIPIGHIGESVY